MLFRASSLAFNQIIIILGPSLTCTSFNYKDVACCTQFFHFTVERPEWLCLFLGDGPNYRDLVLKNGVLQPLLALMTAPELSVFSVSFHLSKRDCTAAFIICTMHYPGTYRLASTGGDTFNRMDFVAM